MNKNKRNKIIYIVIMSLVVVSIIVFGIIAMDFLDPDYLAFGVVLIDNLLVHFSTSGGT